MTDLTNVERVDRLDAMIAEGRLLRGEWRDIDAHGRERACLLVALAPEVGDGDVAACPAGVMPEWLAHLTPWIDDEVADADWPRIVRRYAALARLWHVLDVEAWRRLDYAARAVAVREARRHVGASETEVLSAVDGALVLLDRVATGGVVGDDEWAAAWAAALAAWEAAWAAAWAAALAAWEATATAAWATAARAAARAARAAAATETAARAEAWTSIADGVLDAIEDEIDAAERGDPGGWLEAIVAEGRVGVLDDGGGDG